VDEHSIYKLGIGLSNAGRQTHSKDRGRNTADREEKGGAPMDSAAAQMCRAADKLDQTRGESEAYTAEEEALVEERLKNLGYL
jgi:hypothetical protein